MYQVRLWIVGVWSALRGAGHSRFVSPGKTHEPSEGGAQNDICKRLRREEAGAGLQVRGLYLHQPPIQFKRQLER